MTPLFLACFQGFVVIVRTLLDNGANMEATLPTNGTTPLFFASIGGHAEVVRELLQRNANTEVRPINNMTCLHIACKEGHEEVVRALLEKGADPTVYSLSGLPLHLACLRGRAAIISLLLSLPGADANAPHHIEGTTPLQYAVRHGHLEAVRVLLRGGARVETSLIRDVAVTSNLPVLGELLLHALSVDDEARTRLVQHLTLLPETDRQEDEEEDEEEEEEEEGDEEEDD